MSGRGNTSHLKKIIFTAALIFLVTIMVTACGGDNISGKNNPGGAPAAEDAGHGSIDEQPPAQVKNPAVRQVLFRGDSRRSGISGAKGPGESASLLWKFKTGEGVYSSPAVHRDVIYLGGRDGVLYALDSSTGEEKWRYQPGSFIRSSPCMPKPDGSSGSLHYQKVLNLLRWWKGTPSYSEVSTGTCTR